MAKIDTNPLTGMGMKQEWIDNTPQEIIYLYHNHISKEINPDYFILNLYKYLRENFNFRIIFEYANLKKQRIVRPDVYINGRFIFGLNWRSNKWNAIQQCIIHFYTNYFVIDTLVRYNKNTQLSSVDNVFDYDTNN